MIAAIIAVIGTLLGALLSSLMQQRATRLANARADRTAEREQRLTTITELATTVSAHRTAMWAREEARFTGASEERLQELRDRSHETRAAITSPSVQLRLLISDPQVRAAADAAVQATYDMRNATDLDTLRQLRSDALTNHNALIDASNVLFA